MSIRKCSMAAAILAIFCLTAPVSAQQGGDTGGATGGTPEIPDFGGTAGTNNTNSGGNTGGNTGAAPIGLEELLGGLENQLDDTPIENLRQQPFVGRSIEQYGLQTSGAHPRTNAGSPGGGTTTGGGGGGFQFTNRGGQNGQQGVQGGTSNSIVRKSLRTRLSPRIVLRSPVSSRQVGTRFQQRLTRMPATIATGPNVSVRVENKTAFLSGVVATTAERDRVERMARLEPGIYRIDNKIQVQGGQ